MSSVSTVDDDNEDDDDEDVGKGQMKVVTKGKECGGIRRGCM